MPQPGSEWHRIAIASHHTARRAVGGICGSQFSYKFGVPSVLARTSAIRLWRQGPRDCAFGGVCLFIGVLYNIPASSGTRKPGSARTQGIPGDPGIYTRIWGAAGIGGRARTPFVFQMQFIYQRHPITLPCSSLTTARWGRVELTGLNLLAC